MVAKESASGIPRPAPKGSEELVWAVGQDEGDNVVVIMGVTVALLEVVVVDAAESV